MCSDIVKTYHKIIIQESLMHKMFVFQHSTLQISFGSHPILVLYFAISDPFCPAEHVRKHHLSLKQINLSHIPYQSTWFPCPSFEIEPRPWNCSNTTISVLFAIPPPPVRIFTWILDLTTAQVDRKFFNLLHNELHFSF